MFSMRLLSRGSVPQYAATIQRLHTSTILFDSSSSSSDSDKEQSKKKKKSKAEPTEEQKMKLRQETVERLNSLVEKMMTAQRVNIDVPVKKPKVPKVKEQRYEVKLYGAAKDAAASLGGDVQKTESELLHHLLGIRSDKLNDQDKEKLQSTKLTIKDFMDGMRIERNPQEPRKHEQSEPIYDRRSMGKSGRQQTLAKQFQSRDPKTTSEGSQKYKAPVELVNLYQGDSLNIFNSKETRVEPVDMPKLTTWELLQKNEFKLALTQPPENIFQEMIMWTEQGKLWKFPIDNEQGLEEEQSIHFSDHVFMERHLKEWCPKRGPIRHFMHLVCVGLSKNPYMTVREKQDHIAWYRDYFASKQELLQEIGAIEAPIPQTKEIAA